jgi:hypothetical protein
MTAVTCTVTLRTHARLAAENSQQRVSSIPTSMTSVFARRALRSTGRLDDCIKWTSTPRRARNRASQGCMLYELTMPELRLLPLIERFVTMLAELPVFADAFGVI